MLPILLSVVVISFSGVMMPGPMFAVALAKSYKSAWAGTWMSLGHAVIEVPLILLIYFGFAHFFQSTGFQLFLSIAGSAMIVWLGIDMFRARKKVVSQGKDLPYNSFTAGIIMSASNPFFLLWWATIGWMLISRIVPYGTSGLTALIIAHWLCDLIWLTLVSNVVYRTHALWGQKLQEGIFIACSALLVGFGVWFLISGVQLVV